MFRKMNNCSGRKAFTLTEILVAIAILAVIAVLAFPALNQALNKAKQATSTSNLKSIHQGLMTIVVEGPPGFGKGPGFFPSWAGGDEQGRRYIWTHLVGNKLGYVEKTSEGYDFTADINSTVFKNPLREDDIPYDPTNEGGYDALDSNSHYGYNAHLGSFSTSTWRDTNPPYGHVNQARVTRPSQTILVAESDGDGVFDALAHGSWAPPGRVDSVNRVLCVFVDGHVEVLSREEILSNQETYLFPN